MPTSGSCTSKIVILLVIWIFSLESMQWKDVPRVSIEKTGYTFGERSWTAATFILFYEGYTEWDFELMARGCRHTAKTRSY